MPKAPLRRRSYAITDVGRKRPQNEDAFLADDTLGLYVVADGVGGHAKGEVASAESVDHVRNYVLSNYGVVAEGLASPSLADDPDEFRNALRRLLESAVQNACYMVYGIAQQDPEGVGMSTTLSALLLAGDHAAIAQVGDSRVYRLHDGQAMQLTVDHTLANHQVQKGMLTAEEARRLPNRNAITRAVGHKDYVEVDTFALGLDPGDRYMLCTDGLHGYLASSEVLGLLSEATVEAVARRAVELANDRGGRDNVTALVVAVR
jgi:protein phosphatase